jgi:integrase
MRDAIIYNVVWNRKKALGLGLVQIEILFQNRSKKYISTGYKVLENQWDPIGRVITNHPLAVRMNKKIQEGINKLRSFEITSNEKGALLTSKDIINLYTNKNVNSFVNFLQVELDKMTVASGTVYLHKRVKANLEACGIINFSDLTYNNIDEFDRYIKGFLSAQTSVSKQHSVVKSYTHLAQKKGLIGFGESPYNTFTVPKGKSKIRTRLDDKEIEKMSKVEVVGALGITKDLFMFTVYTGLSYKDLQNVTKSNLRSDGPDQWIEGLRKKNGEFYSVYLLPDAVKLIEKYKGKTNLFPVPDQYKQNRDLKLLAVAAKINKNITTHTGRHTAASWMLRKGIPLSVIKDILGHQDIDTTEIYAKLERSTIKEEMKRAFLKAP